MCEDIVQIIYFLFLRRGGERSSVLEFYMNYFDGCLEFSEDQARNEPEMYRELFSLKCNDYFLELFKSLMINMKGRRREESDDILLGLEFVQSVGATALWRFRCDLSSKLEDFVREFDMLDVFEERERLYLLAQA